MSVKKTLLVRACMLLTICLLAGCGLAQDSNSTHTPPLTPLPTTSKIITITPSEANSCPTADSKLKPPDFEKLSVSADKTSFWTAYINYLNSGGVLQVLPEKWLPAYQVDLTMDGSPEYIVQTEIPDLGFSIFGCQDGQYQELAVLGDFAGSDLASPGVIAIADGNLNGLPEIIVLLNTWTQAISAYGVFEWNGVAFESVVMDDMHSPRGEISGMGPLEILDIQDIDGNGTLELIWKWNVPVFSTYREGLPWRKETDIYRWNGKRYIFYEVEYSAPEYRFQAVQDGDRASLAGEYEKALDFYQQAIFSDKLDWWSLERRVYEQDNFPVIKPTPIASLLPDPNEYPNLAAYARYRIMLLHIVHGFLPEAQEVYTTLVEKYPVGDAGHAYVELASTFWNEYQSSGSIEGACSQVIQYTETHPQDILFYIGNSEYNEWPQYGEQGYFYEAVDICPFR